MRALRWAVMDVARSSMGTFSVLYGPFGGLPQRQKGLLQGVADGAFGFRQEEFLVGVKAGVSQPVK